MRALDARRIVGASRRTLACAAASILAAACDGLRPAPAFHGAVLEPPASAAPLRLPIARADGAAPDTFDLARETRAGRAAVVFFGYTHCPDVCPTTLADWTRVRRALTPEERARVRFVFVTVDPERDTPAIVARYVAQFDSGVVAVAPTRAEVDAVQRAWGIASFREPAPPGAPDTSYTVSHSAQSFAVDPVGRLRLTYPLGTRPADIAADLRILLRESSTR